MRVVPVTLRKAQEFIDTCHRHNKAPQGHRFSIGLEAKHELFGDDPILVGVAVVGRPVSRHLDDGFTAEVTRVCVVESAPLGPCSKLYGAARAAWRAMGGRRIFTYTLQSESGASLRGAGFVRDAELPGNGDQWLSRPGRVSQAVTSEPKVRWVCTFF